MAPHADPFELRINPRIRNMIPSVQPDELRLLEESLELYGCRDPLVTWSKTGELLDGHNRYAICRKHGWHFDVIEIGEEDIPDERAAMVWVLKNQLGRRNLTDAQRVQLALELEKTLAPEAKERSRANLKRGKSKKPDVPKSERREPRGRSIDQVAKTAGVGKDTVSKVKRVLAHGDDETKQAMLSGEVSINAAAKKVPAKERKRAPKGPEPPLPPPRLVKTGSKRTEVDVLDEAVAKINQTIDAAVAEDRRARPMVVYMLRQIATALLQRAEELSQ